MKPVYRKLSSNIDIGYLWPHFKANIPQGFPMSIRELLLSFFDVTGSGIRLELCNWEGLWVR